MQQTLGNMLHLKRSLCCIEFDGEESYTVKGSKVTRQLLSDHLLCEVGLFSNTYTCPAVWKMQSSIT